MVKNARKTKNDGGMMRNVLKIGKTIGKPAVDLSKEVGKDYLQTRTKKILKDVYEDEDTDLLTNPDYIISGRKPPPPRKIHLLEKNKGQAMKSNMGGKTNKRKYRRNKTNKTNKRIKKYRSIKRKPKK
jgi:hypothetical protein